MDVVLICKKGEFIHYSHQGVNRDYDLEPVSFSSRIFSLSMLLRVRSLIKQYSFNNVVFFGASELKTLYFSFLGFNINLLIRHGTTKSKAKTDWFHRLIYSRVNHHVALSEHLLRNVRQIVPSTPGVDYRIIYPSFEFSGTIAEQKTDAEGLLITHVGRLVRGKGQIDAVIACKKLAAGEIEFRLELIGGVEDVALEKELKSEIERLGLAERVNLRGHINNVSEVLSYTDIFLFPSAGEGMPNAFIEALHYGVPCLAYRNTVFPEFVDMGFYVRLVKDGDVDELSQALLDVVSDIENEKQRSKNNPELAKDYFQVERELSEWHAILI
jgi:glycosyltransferase involved in cell wall biosynthesis